MKRLIAALPLLIAGIAHADSVEWKLDTSHTTVGFSVPHLVVSSVDGRFKEATAKINLDDADLTKSQVSVEINAGSIDTGDQKRDDHLKSPDFFDTKKFPKLTFKSTKIAKAGSGFKLTGDLTIRDVTKSVVLDATLSAPVKTPWGNQARAAKVSGKIKRGDFGLKWNKALEAGGVVVGDEVTIEVKAEVTK
ncbi:MAG: protein yceI precursor [Polyangiaceae bacterium]|jgi:polyisoprenoid-binding protein YceI|nr:protein yceI precursor [Polyangiaceae bacterium]